MTSKDNSNNNNNNNSFDNSIASDSGFSPRRLLDAFQKSIIFDDSGKPYDVGLKDYLLAYEEIVK
jgi:hypothetical protein